MKRTSPLDGMNVLVPRGKKEAQSFSALIRSYGGMPVEIPLIAFEPLRNKALFQARKQIHTYDWVIFTSKTAVDVFFENFSLSSPFPKIAVIGEKTKKMIADKGLKVQFVPGEYVAEGFVEDFLPLVEKGMKVLIPKGNLARDYIAASLSEKGANVDEIIVYKTTFPRDSISLLREQLSGKGLDILPFTSPSTVDHFMEAIKELGFQNAVKNSLVGCIGPVTKERAEAHGLQVHAVPEEYTVHSMLKSIIRYLAETRREK
ncbi:uroporphyrinogen-III synthase [Cytobacillus firmus]|uniref:uroporphyrinogen-III synthase n=1 Tax=Cytobacillus firmus TaxID=1399 RepID=UPI00077C5318|nr:uroporphyrinogen-III synthase [Cytobacillus firmus]MBG9543578.1 uroporphyrinogen-III synthase [Cytobacillus firmus]MBG9554802.1 uroporphyrinogen-III synthase [Cytobacillus firmus]MBG9555780.1 uroporphyrinogen-III synthase [Cytobacillus firmus]MBG9574702.1 uroporphyrinogen-III synthase [Cytobacillus firmus]MEC1891349.1 uroporphyrinogen-III synthase [Cytobacillus firmus]